MLPHQGWRIKSVLLFTHSWGENNWIHTFPTVLVLCEMQSVSSGIWTRVAVSISYDDNGYTTGTSKFICWCSSIYIGMTCQRLEVRVRQYIPRSRLSGRLTSRHSEAVDSAIGEHLLTINNCRTRYEDDCFSVLHRARNKSHLKSLEAIYISLNHPSLCRQLNNHILNIFRELLDTGVT